MSIERRLLKIDQACASIRKEIRELPEGTVYAYMSEGHYRFKGKLNNKNHYYKQDEMPMVKSLLLKRYLSFKLQDLETTKKLLLSC